MKPASASLLALLASRQFYAADVYTINLADGGTLYYTSFDIDLTVNGQRYSSGVGVGPYWDRTDNKAVCHWKSGTDTDTLSIDVLPGTSTIFGTPFLTACRQGLFDGAEFILDKIFMPTPGDTRRGPVRYFVGRVAEIDAGRSVATFTINSHLELLNLQLPRNLYQAGCLNNLGDAQCTVNLNNFKTTGTILAGSTQASLNVSIAGTFQQGYFDLGTINFTDGVLNGTNMTVKSVTYGSPTIVNLIGFAAGEPNVGDAFTLFAGCNKNCDLPITVTGIMTQGQNNLDITSVSDGVSLSALVGLQISGFGINGTYIVTGYEDVAPGTPPVPTSGALILSQTFTASSNGTPHDYNLPISGPLNGCSKFNNLKNFRGFPFIPQPVVAV